MKAMRGVYVRRCYSEPGDWAVRSYNGFGCKPSYSVVIKLLASLEADANVARGQRDLRV